MSVRLTTLRQLTERLLYDEQGLAQDSVDACRDCLALIDLFWVGSDPKVLLVDHLMPIEDLIDWGKKNGIVKEDESEKFLQVFDQALRSFGRRCLSTPVSS